MNLEQKERAQKLIQDDIRKLSLYNDASVDRNPVKEGDLWIISGGRSILVRQHFLKYFKIVRCEI